jgi:hypothetical protein
MIRLKPNGRAWRTTPAIVIAAGLGLSLPVRAQESKPGENWCSATSAGAIERSI